MQVIPGHSMYYADVNGNIYAMNRSMNGVADKLPTRPNKEGYSIVTIHIDGKPVRQFVHRLVWMAFNGVTTRHVVHIDGDKSNNALVNLKLQDKPPSTMKQNRDTEIARKYKEGKSAMELAFEYKLSLNTIYKAIKQ